MDTLCESCGHRLDIHDATATRYCAATSNLSATRGCICRGESIDMMPKPEVAHQR